MSASNNNNNDNSQSIAKVDRKLQKVLVRVNRALTHEEPLQVQVRRFGTAQQIKKKIKKQTGIPIFQQVIILNGRQLAQTERIASLLQNTSKELTVFLVVDKTATKKSAGIEGKIDAGEEISASSSVTSASIAEEIQQIREIELKNGSIAEAPMAKQPAEPFNLPPARSDAPILKLSFQGINRRVPFEGNSYAELTTLFTNFFGVKNPRRMLVQYKDEDEDLITVSTDAELIHAIRHHSTKTEPKILRLQLSLKPLPNNNKNDAKINERAIVSKDETPRTKLLQAGDVVQLTNIDGFHLSLVQRENLAKKADDSKVIEPKLAVVVSKESSESTQWIVEEVPSARVKSSDQQLIFLKNKICPNQSHLKVKPTGELLHNGGAGVWAQFSVENISISDGCVKLRSIGRSNLKIENAADNAFVGIVKKENKPGYEVVATLNKDDVGAVFQIQRV